MGIVVLVWCLNLAISIWNAYAVGRSWVEARHYGGWPYFMSWMGAIMAASGLSWCLILLEALLAYSGGWLSMKYVEGMISLGYILVIPGVLLSGMTIMIDSWGRAYRTRKISDMGIAAYNTYAQIHNTYHAVSGIGDAFDSISDIFKSDSSSDDDGGGAVLLVILLVAVGILGGVMLTVAIIKYSAGRNELPDYN